MKPAATELRAAASAGEVALADGAPPRRVLLLRIGDNVGRDGRQRYRIDDRAHAEAVVAASDAYRGATEPMIDYDHQSVYGAVRGVGGTAPAAGWIKGFTVDDAGIWADPVEWTEAASARLRGREYRYISPYFGHASDGRVTRIFNAALTNRPELELQAVASQIDGDPMDQIIQALGLAAGASLDQVLAAIAALRNERESMCSAFALPATATADELRAAASAARQPDPKAFVPRAELDALRQRLDMIDEERVTASVDAAIKDGRLTPSSRDWALGYARKDLAGFTAFVGAQPKIVSEGPEERRAAAIAADTLTAEETAICAQLGITPDAYRAARKKGAF